MITREVREWLQKVEHKQYSHEDAMREFIKFSSYLTREEIDLLTHYRNASSDDRRLVRKVLALPE